MPNEEQMTVNERREHPGPINERYLKGDKRGRGRLADEIEVPTARIPRARSVLHCGPMLSHALAASAVVARRSLAAVACGWRCRPPVDTICSVTERATLVVADSLSKAVSCEFGSVFKTDYHSGFHK